MQHKPQIRQKATRNQAKGTHKLVDARLITSIVGESRYPFSEAMFEVGYGLFEPLPGHPDLPPLWPLATSEDPAERARFLRLMNLFEGICCTPPTILDIAISIHGGIRESLDPIQLVDEGMKSGMRRFAVVSGERHILAVLYLWNKGLRREPVIYAEIVKTA